MTLVVPPAAGSLTFPCHFDIFQPAKRRCFGEGDLSGAGFDECQAEGWRFLPGRVPVKSLG